jgi:micrococcal nuclease
MTVHTYAVGPAYTYSAELAGVVDGDTVDLIVDLGFRVTFRDRFRLYGPDPAGKLGLNAPEMSTPEGRAAKKWLSNFFAARAPNTGFLQTVHTIRDKREKFGRWLAVILLADGTNVNQALIDAGHAVLKAY